VELKLIGKRPGTESQLRAVLGERLAMTGYVPHRESIRAIAQADVLVNYLDEARGRTLLLSTKLFEYLASGKPVVCINPSHSDRQLLKGKTGVEVLQDPEAEQLAAALRRGLAGNARRDPIETAEFRERYNWSSRARQLAAELDRMLAFPPPAPPLQLTQSPATASLVIPTRNRKDLLRRCLCSALAQSVPVEVSVMDDGSTDGTAEMMEKEFPGVKYCRLGKGRGPTFQRNRGIEMASAEIAFPLDDDSVFSSPRVVEQTLAEFDHPRVAAVGIPFLNPRLAWDLCQRAPSGNGAMAVAHAFVGAAHAVRKDVFLQVGGYREHFFYMGEEGDLSLRFLQAGYIVRLGKADPIYHLESPKRNLALADFCGRRNDVLFAWHNVPMPWLPMHLLGTTLNGLLSGVHARQVPRMLRGTFSGYFDCWRRRRERAPVPAAIYRLHRRLKKKGPLTFEQIEDQLPPLPKPSVYGH